MVVVTERQAHLAAVIWFTGGNNLEKFHAKAAELKGWLASKPVYKAMGDVEIAQYDGPATISFFRRNELQVEVAEVH